MSTTKKAKEWMNLKHLDLLWSSKLVPRYKFCYICVINDPCSMHPCFQDKPYIRTVLRSTNHTNTYSTMQYKYVCTYVHTNVHPLISSGVV